MSPQQSPGRKTALKNQAASFVYQSQYPCPAEYLYRYHAMPGALERLLPPWERNSVVSRQGNISPGSQVKLKMHAGPFPFYFQAHHVEDNPGVMFRDIQEKGPFTSWSHTHLFHDTASGSLLQDKIEYTLPGHRFLPSLIKNHVEKQLVRSFHYRSHTLTGDIALHQRCSHTPLKILVTGASGVLGKRLLPLLTTGGHTVYTLVRRRPEKNRNEIFWDPEKDFLFKSDLPEIDGVIHLAGEPIGLKRWNVESKRRVLESRVKGTRLLADTLAAMSQPPKVLLSASAIGYYGNCGKRFTDETSPAGKDFISSVCSQWENSAQPAIDAGIRTVLLRMGVSMTPGGGALKRILSTSPLGFIRYFGSGEQYISWISDDDLISAMHHALT
ncbi:MAG: NAD-dependent epimerase/dehydratase family protein, partial [Deltaproteobacteria bacterium]|nr:NAD-dependent epimerase/dehydratase family protein [Deltaproteobacteria bacterium]